MAILPGDGPPGRDECDASPALGMTTNPLPVTRYPLPATRYPFCVCRSAQHRCMLGSLRLVAAAGSSEHQHAAVGQRLAAASSSQLLLFPLPVSLHILRHDTLAT
jgi:hypothetical protein